MSTTQRKKAKGKEADPVVRRYEDVTFHFLSGVKGDEESLLPGTVTVRPGGMVLEIREGASPYTIVGNAYKHWFEGTNQAGSNDVDAKWADLAGTYVGTWIEENYEYLFSFELGLPVT